MSGGAPDPAPPGASGSGGGFVAFPVVLAGPSGAGKTSVCARLLAEPGSRYLFSVSMTTRPPRAGERDRVDYRFVSEAEFEALVESGAMLEHATVHGERYGTPRDNLDRARAAGRHLLLDIDVQGARQLRDAVPESVSIFIVPPTADRIVRQLRGRGSETRAQLDRRVAGARAELQAAPAFDYLVVNDRLADAVAAVSAIVSAIVSRIESAGPSAGPTGVASERPGRRGGLAAADRARLERILRELDGIGTGGRLEA